MQHKSGFINIIGSPNVGKSTLMNKLVGEKLSIITPKAQTTRHRIHGIVNGDDYQIVFSDTPGIIDPAYELHKDMMRFVHSALLDADVLIIMVDISEKQFKNQNLLNLINKKLDIPVFVLVNKIDLSEQDKLTELSEMWKNIFFKAEVIFISALHKFGVEDLKKRLITLLPENPPFYPKDQLTDRPEKFFIAEMIREKIFLNYKKEVPYACEVVVESFKEEPKITKIRAIIYVERESQKGILIGKRGIALKYVGIDSRKYIEAFIQKKIYLELFVKVDKDWRKDKRKLIKYGYTQK